MSQTLETDKKTEVDCPLCKGKFDLTVKQKKPVVELQEQETIQTKTATTIPPVETEKIVTKIMPSKDEPFLECKTCNKSHENPNYSVRPNKKCNNCSSLNGSYRKGCKNCGNSEFEEVSEDDLNDMKIPVPTIKAHEHEEEE